MKLYNLKKLAIIAILVPITWSCENVLEEEAPFYTVGTFYKTAEDAQLAINGIYGHLGANFDSALNSNGIYFANYWTVNAIASDEGESSFNVGNGYNQISDMVHGPDNEIALQMWSNLYLGINAANLAIDNIPSIEMNEQKKNELLGEARFMRGLLYFELVRFFGDVPLQLHSSTSFESGSYLPRASIEDVYSQIFEDFTIAENNLPSAQTGNDNGRPTLWSAKAYMAKAKLQEGVDINTAKVKLEEVMGSNIFSLWANYSDVFFIPNNNGKEELFGISFLEGTDINTTLWEGGHLVFRVLPNIYGSRPNGGGLEQPTLDLYNSFDDNDSRKAVTFMTEDVINGEVVDFEGPKVVKYWDRINEPNVNNTANDLQLLRYSDVLLMYAEVLNEINGGSTTAALNAINTVRERARTEEGALPNLTAMDYSSFKEAILLERRKEFVWEGQRWFDLVRFGKLVEKVNIAKPDVSVGAKHNLFPVPQRERDINTSLNQNTGY
ncbi:RagB/SusD family nutrient uptake outer membrane protein [Winogradskyella bathintestinalis]|uniref:RagB/SusD family nutrient uptake outer membrane protein n=1 Tax=Winogradskyella bathintestinalis TaxID=3035208 RepID=A0ABT7ZX01_9FLAO|nr:RagB/SusD family nutrient uptake outer membrane protein [Winogradskyella bathintestinalis]MDN3493536.1 RagB/SusD family nutrient uptake outer membrane protein [Winogradskyella bathintestinalis]